MKNRKAFTLVELLVVIAILAVLASVSIIGYTAFTKKAVQNNAIAELTQVKTLITAGTTADDNNSYIVKQGTNKYAFSFDDTENKYSFAASDAAEELDLIAEANFATTDKLVFNVTAKTVTYTLTSGTNTAKAVWNVETGSIELSND